MVPTKYQLAIVVGLTIVVNIPLVCATSTITVPGDYDTIQGAIDGAREGDTIVIEPGYYPECLLITKQVSLIGSGIGQTIIDGSAGLWTIQIKIAAVSITGFTIDHAHHNAMTITDSSGSSLTGNAMGRIRLERCRDFLISDNQVLADIYAYSSRDIAIKSNAIAGGIHLDGSTDFTLRYNTIDKNQLSLLVTGWDRSHFVHDIDASNLISGKPIIYLLNRHDMVIGPSAYQDFGYLGIVNSRNVWIKDLAIRNAPGEGIMLAATSNCTIENVTIADPTSYGISLVYCTDCAVRRCSIVRALYGLRVQDTRGLQITDTEILDTQEDGINLDSADSCIISRDRIRGSRTHICLMDSRNCQILGNTLADLRMDGDGWRPTGAGIRLIQSSDNLIFHNNWFNNAPHARIDSGPSVNVWDNGSISGGNYWDDYRGVDLNGDGIGDTPYVIDSRNIDRHPVTGKDGWLAIKWVCVDRSRTSRGRCDVNSIQEILFHALWGANRSDLQGETIYVNNIPHVTNLTGWVKIVDSSPTVGKKSWIVTGVGQSDTLPFITSTPNPTIMWDTVIVTLVPCRSRNDIGVEGLYWTARYSYDNTTFLGDVYLNDTTVKQTVGAFGYEVSAILDQKYGLTTLRASKVLVIFDRVNITLSTRRSRIDVGTAPRIEWVGHYEYDAKPFTGSIHLNNSLIPDKATLLAYRVDAIQDPTYGLTTFHTNEIKIIFDRILAGLSVGDDRMSVGDCVELRIRGIYEYDRFPFNGTVVLNESDTRLDSPGRRVYTTSAVVDPVYGLTCFSSDSTSCIWDRVGIALVAEDDRVDIGSSANVSVSAIYEYDGSPFSGTVEFNDTTAKNSIGRFSYTVTRVHDPRFSISAFSCNTAEVIFDAVFLNISIQDDRIDAGARPSVSWSGRYMYDQTYFAGAVIMNDTIGPYGQVGRRAYTVQMIHDPLYGLSTYQSNTVTCIFDRVAIHLTAPARVDVGTQVTITAVGWHEFDEAPFVGSVTLNNSQTRYFSVCCKGYATVAISDPTYGLTAFITNTVSVVFDEIQVRLGVLDDRIDVGSTASIITTATHKYDGTPFDGSVVLNDTQLFQRSVGRRVYTVKGIVDETHGLLRFDCNEIAVIFDAVNVTLDGPRHRIQVGRNATIGLSARYVFDGGAFKGSILLNRATVGYVIGAENYTVRKMTDELHGLTTFSSNCLPVVFDRVKARQIMFTAMPGSSRVRTILLFESDGSPADNAVVVVNGILARNLGGGKYEVSFGNWNLATKIRTKVSNPGFDPVDIEANVVSIGNILLIALLPMLLSAIVARKALKRGF